MKNSKKLLKSASVLVFSLLFAPMVSVASINTVLDADTSLNSNTSASSSSVNAGVDVNIGATGSGEASSTDNMNMETDSDLSLKLNASGVAVRNSSQVNSLADLDVFSSNVTKEDEKVDEVRIDSRDNETKVAVVYKHKGKLFGFIPVTIKSTTAVMAKANTDTAVESHLSWWSFLVTGENYDRDAIETEIRNNAIVLENAKVDASASAKAKVAEAIISEVDSYASTSLASSK